MGIFRLGEIWFCSSNDKEDENHCYMQHAISISSPTLKSCLVWEKKNGVTLLMLFFFLTEFSHIMSPLRIYKEQETLVPHEDLSLQFTKRLEAMVVMAVVGIFLEVS